MTMIHTSRTTSLRAPLTSRPSLFVRLGQMHSLWRQRQTLKSLNAAALADIGLTRAQAKTEASRPVWDAPAVWKR